jgi:hypothetical protein
MRHRFIVYLLCVTLIGSMLSWGSMLARAGSGRGSGNSWFSRSWGGGGYYGGGGGGGFAGSMGGGHK